MRVNKIYEGSACYAKRHLAQRPHDKIGDSPWRYSLMNWGHDPAKS